MIRQANSFSFLFQFLTTSYMLGC